MAKHRSLSNALLSPEKMAFIKGHDANQGQSVGDAHPPIQSNAVVVPVVELAPGTTSAPKEVQSSKSPSINNLQPSQDESINRNVTAPANEDYLVAITTRLQARTADALRRAHLEQKLNRCEPATQQEIIELAVQQWLRTHSFLD